jgi:hypothetical protein
MNPHKTAKCFAQQRFMYLYTKKVINFNNQGGQHDKTNINQID